MNLNNLRPAPGAHKPVKRVARGTGSGLGKTAGRGHAGQNSRSGGGVAPGFEGGQMPLQRRVPKYGFRSAAARETAEVRLTELNRVAGDVVDLDALKKANIVRHDMKRAKIVLKGDVERALTVRGLSVSKGARAAIEKAGGKVEE